MADSTQRKRTQRTNGESSGNQSTGSSSSRRVKLPAGQVGNGMSDELFRELRLSDIDTEGVDEDGNPNVSAMVEQLLSRDFILGNASDAEIEEVRWLARNVVDMLEASFPPEESVVQGSYRKVLLRDDSDGRRALDDVDRQELQQTVLAFLMRITRSEDGWQQDKVADSHDHRVVERRDSSPSRTLFGGR
jgi:hypothetical protein